MLAMPAYMSPPHPGPPPLEALPSLPSSSAGRPARTTASSAAGGSGRSAISPDHPSQRAYGLLRSKPDQQRHSRPFDIGREERQEAGGSSSYASSGTNQQHPYYSNASSAAPSSYPVDQHPYHQQRSPTHSSNRRQSSNYARSPSPPSSSSRAVVDPPSQSQPQSQSSRPASSTTSTPGRTPSRHLLQRALDLAHHAVTLDHECRYAEALEMYKETVERLAEVMARVEASEEKKNAGRKARDRSREEAGGARQDEGRTLRGIYETYVERVATLSTHGPWSPVPESQAKLPEDQNVVPSHPTYLSPEAPTDLSSTTSNGHSTSSSYDSYVPPTAPSFRSSTGSFSSMTQAGTSVSNGGSQPPTPSMPDYTTVGGYHPTEQTLIEEGSYDGERAEDEAARLRRQSLLEQLELDHQDGSLSMAFGKGKERERDPAVGRKRMSIEKQPSSASSSQTTFDLTSPSPSSPSSYAAASSAYIIGRDSSLHQSPNSPSTPTPISVPSTVLVHPTPSNGTIGQRRKPPTPAAPPLLHPTSASSYLPPSDQLSLPANDDLVLRSVSVEPKSQQQQQPAEKSSRSGHSKSLSGRLRALSQPGKARPPVLLPPPTQPLPVPVQPSSGLVITRKHSFPSKPQASLLSLPTSTRSLTSSAVRVRPVGSTRAPPPAAIFTNHVASSLLHRTTSSRSSQHSYSQLYAQTTARTLSGAFPPSSSSSLVRPIILTNGFKQQSLRPRSHILLQGWPQPPRTLRRIGYPTAPPPIEQPPKIRYLFPYYLMRTLRLSMSGPAPNSLFPSSFASNGSGSGVSGGGAFLFSSRHVPTATWYQTGAHLVALETKIMVLDGFVRQIRELEKVGAILLVDESAAAAGTMGTGKVDAPQAADAAVAVNKVLETFVERTMKEGQSQLEKKMGNSLKNRNRNGSTTTTLTAWGSKLSRGLDRLSAGKNPDAQLPTYIQTLALFLHKAQLFERHLLASLPLVSPTGQPTPAYRSLPPNLLASIQARLKRITAYLHASVLLFVLRDLEMLSERFVKRRDKELGSSH